MAERRRVGRWVAGDGWMGREITQFTYFQPCGGMDLDLSRSGITYRLERMAQFLQDKESIYDIVWAGGSRILCRQGDYMGRCGWGRRSSSRLTALIVLDVSSLWDHCWSFMRLECLGLLEQSRSGCFRRSVTLD